mgnify:CR=1 FL=1
MTRANPASPLARYRRVLAAVRAERGERCEACGVPARSAHHVVTVGLSGIASELVYEPSNLLLLCDDCHCLCHPGRRAYPWLEAGKRRSRALGRAA